MGNKEIPDHEYEYLVAKVQQQMQQSSISTRSTEERVDSSFESWLRRQIREILWQIGKPFSYIEAIIDELQKIVKESLGIKHDDKGE